MSRAYCLTCNEQVHETAGGTCPLGHPVTAHDHGPEPWVGFASPSTGTGFVDDDLRAREREAERGDVAMARLDTEGRRVVHAGAQANGRVNGHANGHVNGHALGGGHGDHDPFPSTFGHRSSFAAEASETTERAPANGQAADDLAALLAEALEGEGASAAFPATSDAPTAPEPPAPPSSSEDWGDLASLAAELRLDADADVDDGPAAAARPVGPATPVDHTPLADAAEPPHRVDAPADDDLDEASIASADIDELLAELTGGASQAPAPQATTEAVADPMPEAAAPEPPPAPATPPPPPPPPVVPQPDPVAATDSVPPLDDLRSPPPPPVEDAFDLWEHDDLDTGHAEVAPAAEVDLTNFTARGRRVGGSGAPAPRRAPFGRKKKG